ncbi:MAG: glycosyltransferase [Planctomycetes bacterium]|nr:glycosyltransferase [Planctomycetota bacterium]
MPTVLRVIARLNMGGPARHVVRITAPLAERGYRTVLATGHVADGELDLLHEAEAAGLDVRRIPSLGRDVRPLADLSALRVLRRLVRSVRPDIVHTHTAKAGVLGRMAASALRPRPVLVHSYHGHVLEGTFGPRASFAFAALERRLAPRTAALVAVAPEVRDELLRDHRVGRPGQYAIIPPGVDFARTAPDPRAGAELRRALDVPEGAVLVGCVGRLAPVKDVARLLAAWEACRPEPRDPSARLLVMGAGPCEDELRARAAGRPDVLFERPRAELGAVYGALDLLVLPSRAEGLPQVLVEALAAGVPVIASRVGGVPGLVHHGRDGLLVPRGDVAPLAEALSSLLGDAALRARLAAGTRGRSFAEMTADAVAERLAALYAGLLAERGAVR